MPTRSRSTSWRASRSAPSRRRRPSRCRSALLLLALALSACGGNTTTKHTVTYDRYSLSIDGRRTYVWSAEFHYWRLPSTGLWRDVLQKIRAGGFNTVSIYFDWGYHSPKPGAYDFSGVRDVDRLLRMTEEAGLYVIARPGPYINAETDGGGLPAWVGTLPGRSRSSDPDFQAAGDEWLHHVDRIIRRHQWTTGGGNVILYQLENEYGINADPAYMAHLKRVVRGDGITVPLTHNHCCGPDDWAGVVDMAGQDSYPQGFHCSHPERWARPRRLPRLRPGTPVFTPEFQGGAFDPWGGPGYAKCRELTGPSFQKVFYKGNVADGATLQSLYMTFGGTSWGWLPDPQKVYTSYDYGAAITEARGLTAKYDEDKRQGLFYTSVAPLAKTRAYTPAPPTNRAILARARVNPDDGTRFVVLRHADARSRRDDSTHIALPGYPRVPQQSAIRLDGRDAKTLVANYRFGAQRLMYSTSELMTRLRIGDEDVALLYGNGEGETVLRYASRPTVTTVSGTAPAVSWNGRDLRLNYTHRGLTELRVGNLRLLLADDATAATFWRPRDDVLVRGPYLVRTAALSGDTLALTGDTMKDSPLQVWSTAGRVTWNGQPAGATVPGPPAVALPPLTGWRFRAEAPESGPGFDDTRWAKAGGRLAMDDHGFHHGDVWYRGHFRGRPRTAVLHAITGTAGTYLAWLNGRFLGAHGGGTWRLRLTRAHAGENVLSVLVRNMGHNEDFNADDHNKEPRGLVSADLGRPVDWRIQGGASDPVRGPMNNGGLYGERSGWHLPGFPDSGWRAVSLPRRRQPAGVGWYRTTFSLDEPAGVDASLGLTFADSPRKRYRVQIFLNGWNLGQYVNHVGPQRTFVLPDGILRTHGTNTLAFAVLGGGAGPGRVSLTGLKTTASPLSVPDVPSPGYGP